MLRQALRAGAQSGTIMATADMGTQFFFEGKSWSWETANNNNSSSSSGTNSYSPERTLRWAMTGVVLHGPYFFAGFSVLDRYFGAATSLANVAKKTAAAQFFLFPPYLVGLFGWMGMLEGHPNIADKIQRRVPETFLSGCVFWPMANVLNFTYVPPTWRVPYLAISAGIWNSYLSWTNAKEERQQQLQAQQEQNNEVGTVL